VSGRSRRLGLIAALALAAPPALAHDLQHTVAPTQALVVELRYPDGSPFTFEAYEVYREPDKVPYQVGRTDASGRIAFLPDGPASWRVRAFSEDGHGLDVRVESTAAGAVATSGQPAYDRFTRIVVGVAVILGLFGILTLFVRRRSA
jgi:nickel transport protein